MTEQKKTEQKPSTDTVKSYGWLGNTLSIAISLAIGVGGLYIYYHGQQQNAALKAENLALQQETASLTQQQSADKQNFSTKLQELADSLQQANSQRQQQAGRITELQNRVSAFANTDIENWRLAQASSLVKMAGRKVWSEQDMTTAIALLKDADQNLAEMDDPSLLYARKAIMADIDSLTKIKQIDLDGIILMLNQLSNQVDNLHLANKVEQATSEKENEHGITASLADWRQNLGHSWHSFMDNFVTITPRDNSKEPLLAPNQGVYLRENIRSRLLIAAQAVPRHQVKIYQDALKDVQSWVNAYFDTTDSGAERFLTNVASLQKRPLSINVPEQLNSQPILAELVRKRIYNLPDSTQSQTDSQSEILPEAQSQSTTADQVKTSVEGN
ncbi:MULTISPECIES: uroporphyrinogen-III C-methyltransferase [Xenorhabdus]|uniref:uroporphyrinogen-III C-methyltransferase n=1 Tax=Xenorhabdus TaxID=626 RepID=UPI00064B5EC5|nr:MULTISPECIES: uroporphyrinogen-III C-methyltransferase [Xenorhabdus]KLU17408.1 uroporphyrin-III methyltransferase [Xenorhabdus griffiniae]KOP32880.1 uroporphyrin-III methyltransferase [Xenorhabdus sp. GDc328]